MRSPLTSVIGYAELMNDGEFRELTPAQAEALGVVARNAVRLEQLIADLMTLSQLETGLHAELDASEVDLAAFVKDVASTMRPIMACRRHEAVSLIEDEPVAVLCAASQ